MTFRFPSLSTRAEFFCKKTNTTGSPLRPTHSPCHPVSKSPRPIRHKLNIFAYSFLLGLMLSACSGDQSSGASAADLVLTNAKIWTGNADQPWASWVAVQDGRILEVGGESETPPTAAETRDLAGQLLLPGFNDSHVHFASAGSLLLGINLLDVNDEKAFIQRVREAGRRLPRGSWITRGAYAFQTLADNDCILSFGSDWPGTNASYYPINPVMGLYAAVTRQTVNGEPAKGWFPEQRIDLETALRAYTWGASFSAFEEKIKGTIEPGKLADFAALDTDLFETEPAQWLEAKVTLTIVGGKVVYEQENAENAGLSMR